MDYFLKALALAITASAIAIHLLSRSRSRAWKSCPANLPPGSLGLPVIGQTLELLRAMRTNTSDQWINGRIKRYGPVSKLSLFCTPTVLLSGPAANKFLFFSRQLQVRPLQSVKRVLGEKSLLVMHGDDHRRIRGALMEFLKPDMLKLYVGRIDAEVRHHLEDNWYGRRTVVTVLPLMQRLTLDITCALLFGLKPGVVQDALANNLEHVLDGVFAFPLNVPFTAFGKSLKASKRARRLLDVIILDKKTKLGQGKASSNNDLISRLLSMTDDRGEQLLTNEEIIDTSMVALIAGRDTTSTLMTFMVRHLANDPATLAAMVQEHEEIAMNKVDGDALAWEDLSKMKFTWRVAQETLRMVPPFFGNFRTAIEDIAFDGYCIPKGWKVLLSANVTHMDPSIFREPAKFDPSRFESQSSMIPPCSFVAFGGGPRICPGMDLAKIETLVTMHYLVRQFTWKLCCKENTFVRDPMPLPLHGLPIQLQRKTCL